MENSRRTALILGLGALALTGAAFLPIDPTAVQQHTAQQLLRGELSGLVPEGAPVPLPVQLTVAADAPLAAAVRTQVEAPTTKVDGVYRPRFAVVEGAAPQLRIEARVEGGRLTLNGELGEKSFTSKARLGDWLALLPPLIALIIALAFRQVVVALAVAVLAGSVMMQQGLLALWLELKSLFGALLKLVDTVVGGWTGLGELVAVEGGYFGQVLADSFNLQILGFTLALVGLVAVVGRMGGTRGLVELISPLARGPRSAQAVTASMGAAIFFDDYANTVVVGTTGRSLTDRRGLSREKLAYIVDSTSAPVAGIAIISTWIGYEVGLFDDLLGVLVGVPDMPDSGYELFFEILPLRFYCLFALALVFLGAIVGRDLGPMYRAEVRARRGEVHPEAGADELDQLEKPGVDPKARNAVIPIGAVLLTTLLWILDVGTADMASFSFFSLADWKVVFDVASDDIAVILFGAALLGSAVALLMAVGQRLLGPGEALKAYGSGVSTLAEAVAVLIGAWAIKSVCDDLGTGMAMVALVGDALPAIMLPLAIFVLSGAVAFATGTSWGTMALVLPVAAPLAAALAGDAPIIVLASLGAVLDGAIWGDHCSPISDTTVLSSTASGCPHLAHVKTQLPYATLAMVAAGLAGYLGVAAGLPVLLAYGLGLGAMVAGLYAFGRDPSAA